MEIGFTGNDLENDNYQDPTSYEDLFRKEEEQKLTSGKTRSALSLCLQKVCLFH